MGWYVCFIGNIHNDEYLIYIFTGKVENGNPIIFNKTLYHLWYKELRNQFSPILKKNTYKNEHVLGLCINIDSYVAHIFYAWSFGHNK